MQYLLSLLYYKLILSFIFVFFYTSINIKIEYPYHLSALGYRATLAWLGFPSPAGELELRLVLKYLSYNCICITQDRLRFYRATLVKNVINFIIVYFIQAHLSN